MDRRQMLKMTGAAIAGASLLGVQALAADSNTQVQRISLNARL